MSIPFAFDLASHPEADLLRAIVRATVIHDDISRARSRSGRVYERSIAKHCREATELDDYIAATPATTPEALRAKAEYALRDVDPDDLAHAFKGWKGAALSALWDVVTAGGLG